jgi:hypothetical protein
MNVCAIRNSFKGCPANVKLPGFFDESIIHIKIGSEYEVHAISIFSGVTFFLIINDFNLFDWKIAWLFETIDRKIPSDWIVSPFTDEPSLVIGPSIIAEDLDKYNRFVEGDPNLDYAMRKLIRNRKMSHTIDLKGGKVRFWDIDELCAEVSLESQLDLLKEDLVSVDYENVTLDLGWYPEFKITGRFVLVLIKNNDWEKPVAVWEFKDISSIKNNIVLAIKKIKEVVHV